MNFHFSTKKLLLLGFLFAVLLVIPLTIYLVQQQQETRSHAEALTTLSFSPSTPTAQYGGKVSLDVILSPSTNQVIAVKMVVKYDPTKLTASESSFLVNPDSGLRIQEGPVVDANTNTLAVTLNIGSGTTNPIRTDTKIGTITFDVTGASALPTEVSFDPSSQVNSIDGAAQGQTYENVLIQNPNPASITIQGGSVSGTDGGGTTPTPTPNSNTTPTPTPNGQVSGQDGSGSNQAPVCSELKTDVATTGPAPYTINFTAIGSDTDGTIDKVSFNFGEGSVEDVTSGGGINSKSVEVTQSYTYETADTYTVTALLTDNDGDDSSDSVNCTTTITVTDDGSGASNSTNNDPEDNNSTTDDSQASTGSAEIVPSPLAATGPGETVMGIGALGGILFLIGALLFFAL